jgi:phage shock protein A
VSIAAFKSWATRLWSGLDRVIAEVEDHDALVTAALRELAEAKDRADAELAGVRVEGLSLRRRLAADESAQKDAEQAAAREPDDAVAIEHLRSARRSRARAARLAGCLQEHATTEARLERRAAELADRLTTWRREHDLLKNRTARVLSPVPSEDGDSIDRLLDRWETILSRAGTLDDAADDAFAALSRHEEDRALKIELEELRRRR